MVATCAAGMSERMLFPVHLKASRLVLYTYWYEYSYEVFGTPETEIAKFSSIQIAEGDVVREEFNSSCWLNQKLPEKHLCARVANCLAARQRVILRRGINPYRYPRCHVMERESFESEAVAKVLNDNFVSIKASDVLWIRCWGGSFAR